MNYILFFYKKKNFLTFLFFLLIFSVCFIPEIPILSNWESVVFYHNFASLEIPYDLRISRRGELTDPSLFSLNLTRIFSEFFEKNPSISSFRILSIIYGCVALFIFFIVLKRWFGLLPSLITISLLSINPVFHMEIHLTNQIMISFLAFIFLIERLQYLEINQSSTISWLGLSVAIVLITIHYAPGRIFSFALIFFWFLKLYLFTKDYYNSKILINKFFFRFIFSIFISVALLILIDWKNLISIVQFYSIIFPPDSETVFTNKNIFDTIPFTFKTNFLVLMESMTGLTYNYHSKYSSNLVAGLRYPILNPFMSFLFISGFLISLVYFKKRSYLTSLPYLSSLILFLICLLPLFLSSVSIVDNEISPTISSYRMFYLLIPVYFFICILIKFLLDKSRVYQKIYNFIVLFFLIAFLLGIKGIVDENSRFNEKITYLKNEEFRSKSFNYWTENHRYDELNKLAFKQIQMHTSYFKAAFDVKNSLEINEDQYNVLYLDTTKFNFIDDFCISHFNYVSVFFSLYLNSLGVDNAWVQIIDKNKPKSILLKAYNERFYSAKVIVNDGILEYKKPLKYRSYLRNLKKGVPSSILVTTKEELDFAVDYYIKNDIKNYSIIKI